MHAEVTFLDLTTGTTRTGQYWSDAPLVVNTHAVWVVPFDGDTTRPIHVHRPHKSHRDTQRALRGYVDVPEFITGVPQHGPLGDIGRYDLSREAA